jgi:hypothetical protein
MEFRAGLASGPLTLIFGSASSPTHALAPHRASNMATPLEARLGIAGSANRIAARRGTASNRPCGRGTEHLLGLDLLLKA